MRLVIEYSNGTSQYSYKIESPNPPDNFMEDAISGLFSCLLGQDSDEDSDMEVLMTSLDLSGKTEATIREELYDLADEIVDSVMEDGIDG